MLYTEVLPIISILVGFVCIVLSIFLFFVKVERVIANKLLGIFLLLTAVDISGWALNADMNISEWVETVRVSTAYLQMPFFLGFIYAACNSKFSIKPSNLLHFIPFFLVLILQVVKPLDWRIISFTLHLQYYIYIAFAVSVLLRARSVFRAHYSDARSAVFNWLMQLVGVSLFAHTLTVFRHTALATHSHSLFYLLQLIGALLVLSIVTWITLRALLQPRLFRGIDKNLFHKPLRGDAYVLDKENHEASRLELFMQKSEPHLDANLSLHKLSEQFGLAQRDLSELINQRFGMHFFDFINQHRIETSKTLLTECKESSILEILNMVGFNSKSSFNTAFKKHTGMTPTEFRKM